GQSLADNTLHKCLKNSQVTPLGYRHDVNRALVDPLNARRVLYTPVETLQKSLGLNRFNVLLLNVNSDPTVLSAVSQLANSFGLPVDSQDPILHSILTFLNGICSHIFLVRIITLALTCGIL